MTDILNQDMERNINGENDYGRRLSITKLGLFIDYGVSKDSVMAVDQLIDYTSNSYEFLTRVNAINMLKSKNLYDESSEEISRFKNRLLHFFDILKIKTKLDK